MVRNNDELLRRIKDIKPGYWWYNGRRYKVTNVQRWWVKHKGLKIKFLGGHVGVDGTKEGSGMFMAKELDLENFARYAQRVAAPKRGETEHKQ